MEVTKWLKPSNSGHDLVTAPSVQAATRVNAKQASHDEDLVKGPHHGDIESLQLLRYPGPSPFARRGPFPSTVNPHMRSLLIAAAPRSRFRRAGLRKTRTILESGIEAMACCGSSTWIRQD